MENSTSYVAELNGSYFAFILPLDFSEIFNSFWNCGIIGIDIDAAKSKLQSIQDRAQRIVARDSSITLKWDSLEQTRKKRISIDFFKSVNGICTESLKNIFTKFDHGKNTRGNGSRLVLPKVRCKSGRKTFAFQGASIYNGRPSDVRNEKYFVNFKRKINTLCF